MRRLPWVAATAILLVAVLLPACRTVPVTGRSSFNPVSVEQEIAMGEQAYVEALKNERQITSGPQWRMVRDVIDRLVAVTDDPGYAWEVRLIDNDTVVNAWALPGGKMSVYTGILPVTRDETGLAVVMAHEIGHVVAGHGTERIIPALGANVAIDLAAGKWGDEAANIAATIADLGCLRPFGRSHELEADRIGLIYMARAGFDPRQAVDFWERMGAATGGGPPEFLSTHPSHGSRIEQIESLLPEALVEYQAAIGAPKP